jgi:hypothetical protein
MTKISYVSGLRYMSRVSFRFLFHGPVSLTEKIMRSVTVYIFIFPCYFSLHWSRYSSLRIVLNPHQLLNQSINTAVYLSMNLLSINYVSIILTENRGDRSTNSVTESKH